MKSNFYFLLIIIALFSYSCNENFSPFGEFTENYVLTCILKSDTSFQVATLSHSYRGDGFNPANTEDPSIIGADVRVWLGDSVYVFRDTSVVRTGSSRYTTPFSFYFNNNFVVEPNDNIEIEVQLQNGRRLKAFSRVPAEIFFDAESDVIIPPVGSDLVRFLWTQQAEGTFFSPRLIIRYRQNENGSIVEKFKRVPVRYYEKNGEFVPYFPQPSNHRIVIYNIDAISRALEEISEGDPDKANYTILQKPIFELFAFDLNLSRYISSTNQTFDDLTVTVNEADFSNIDGGLGIFGSYMNKGYTRIRFLQDYIESFGYNFVLDN
jgi:hypothetical protein